MDNDLTIDLYLALMREITQMMDRNCTYGIIKLINETVSIEQVAFSFAKTLQRPMEMSLQFH